MAAAAQPAGSPHPMPASLEPEAAAPLHASGEEEDEGTRLAAMAHSGQSAVAASPRSPSGSSRKKK
eukprot:COSAG01_NODE_41980_length_444_cov_205.663768_1_plen_65_part_10